MKIRLLRFDRNLKFSLLGRQNLNFRRGFTLFELLIVILLMATVGGISTVILVSALRGSDRVNTISEVRSNGNYAITQIAKMIRFAKDIEGVSALASPPPNPSGWDTCDNTGNPKKHIKISSFDNGTTIFSCMNEIDKPNNGEISSNSASLINLSKVKVKSCSIKCFRADNNEPPTVTIDFELYANSGSAFYEKQATIPFHASITVRNY